MRGVFVPPIITRYLLSQHIYEEEMCQIISLDMSAQPSVSRSNDTDIKHHAFHCSD